MTPAQREALVDMLQDLEEQIDREVDDGRLPDSVVAWRRVGCPMPGEPPVAVARRLIRVKSAADDARTVLNCVAEEVAAGDTPAEDTVAFANLLLASIEIAFE